MIGAGSVITKDIPACTIWYGNPAAQHGFITKSGILLNNTLCDKHGTMHVLEE
jgi:serine acetyltransferase